jgi:hypothetical protein
VDRELLANGELEVLGLLAGSSNYTFLARLGDGPEALVVYKPRRGEVPLWDFQSGTLCNREVAAHLVCCSAGWGLVPPTVLREGPLGTGAVQQFIEHDPSVTAFDLAGDHRRELMQIALFDVIVNNADRKAGHVLIDAQGSIWGIDHGLCFHEQPKLRTVLWDFVGEKIPEEDLLAAEGLIRALQADLGVALSGLLDPIELEALCNRARGVVENEVFPRPGPGRPYPWPPI